MAGPLGPERGDYHAALIARTIAQANAKRGHRLRIEDFLLPWDRASSRRRREQTPEQMLANLQLVHAQIIAREERRHRGDDRDAADPAGR